MEVSSTQAAAALPQGDVMIDIPKGEVLSDSLAQRVVAIGSKLYYANSFPGFVMVVGVVVSVAGVVFNLLVLAISTAASFAILGVICWYGYRQIRFAMDAEKLLVKAREENAKYHEENERLGKSNERLENTLQLIKNGAEIAAENQRKIDQSTRDLQKVKEQLEFVQGQLERTTTKLDQAATDYITLTQSPGK